MLVNTISPSGVPAASKSLSAIKTEQDQQQQQTEAEPETSQQSVADELGDASPQQKQQQQPVASLAATHVSNSLIVIDWDDTLLCTSWMRARCITLESPHVSPEVAEELRRLEQAIVQLLERCLALGRVAIVTNAESSWVERSAEAFVPAVHAMLGRLRVLSARSSFEQELPGQVTLWKVQAYECVFREAFQHEAADAAHPGFNVLSLGDSMYERDALMALAAREPKVVAKSVKFVERPTPAQLLRQLEIVHGEVDGVYAQREAVDLMLTVDYL